jgi:hypothetical protein
MTFSSNICEVCGKSRNLPVHKECSKLKQKVYAAQRAKTYQSLHLAEGGESQSESV